jgi:cathepsin L
MRAISLIVFVLLFSASLALKTRWNELKGYNFEKYVEEYNKLYSDAKEYELRKSIFEANFATINAHNAQSSSYKMGVNHLTDRSTEEYKKLLGSKRPASYTPKYQVPYTPVAPVADVTEVDWRLKGVISDVKDQGDCGSCWSFATSEIVESYYALATGQLHVLSEQQILSCTNNSNDCGGTGGCEGGIPEIAYDMIQDFGGLTSEWRYPYVSYFGTDFPCTFNNLTTTPIAQLQGYTKLESNSLSAVLATVSSTGPLAINVDASTWQNYESGVYTGCNQTYSDIDHVVQLVGFGTDDTYGDYWLVRNSWTPAWGELGYIRIARTDSDNTLCQQDTTPGDGTGCNGGPTVVTTCGPCGLLYDTSFPIIA